jgi:hypothetical protein
VADIVVVTLICALEVGAMYGVARWAGTYRWLDATLPGGPGQPAIVRRLTIWSLALMITAIAAQALLLPVAFAVFVVSRL